MKQPSVFIYEPTGIPVSVAQAAELITTVKGVDCDSFEVNPHHTTPSLERLQSILNEEVPFDLADPQASLMRACVALALESAKKGAYGVGALLGTIDGQQSSIVHSVQNSRRNNDPDQYDGHAERKLVREITPRLQSMIDRSHDCVVVNLSPCSGCLNGLVTAKQKKVYIGSPDPKVGAAFFTGQKLQNAIGIAKRQVVEQQELQYLFPEMPGVDRTIRETIMTLCWESFHATRAQVHQTQYGQRLEE